MKTRGTSGLVALLSLIAVGSLACGASAPASPPPQSPAPSTEQAADAKPATAEPKEAAAAPAEEAKAKTNAEPPAPAPAVEAAAEPCDGEWICLTVPLDGKGKVTKRTTKLIGDPKIDATWSQNTDGRAPATFSEASKPVELLLKHLPGKPGQHLAQIVLKANGRETVIDKRDGEEFNYVGFIAAEKDGAFLVDLRYMK